MPNQVINASLSSTTTPLINFLKKRQENERFAQLVELAATFALVTLFVLFAIRPTVLTISSLYTEIETKKKLKEELKQKINNVIIAQNNFAEFQKRSSLIETTLPSQAEYSNVVLQLLGVTRKNNLYLDNVGIDLKSEKNETLVTKEKDLAAIQIGLQFNPDFNQLRGIIKDVRNIRRLSYFDSISISTKSDKESKKNTISLSFAPQFYYLKVQAIVPANVPKSKQNAK